jgi:ATP-dependent RNA helicase DDX47/RRP3
MLSLDFEKEIQEILRVIPEDRNSYLFSATMTKKVNKLQKLSLKDPTMVEVSNKMQTPKSLIQQYIFVPAKLKDCYLTTIVNDFLGQKTIMFVSTCNNATRTSQVLRNLGFHCIALHGQLSQPKRLGPQ